MEGDHEVFGEFTASRSSSRRERKRQEELRGYLRELLRKFDGFDEAKPAERGINSESYRHRSAPRPDPTSDLKERGTNDGDRSVD